MQPGLHVVSVQAAICSPHQPIVPALAHGHSSDGGFRVAFCLALFAHGRPQHILAQGEVLQAPGVGSSIAVMGCDDIAPILLPHLQLPNTVRE